MSLHARSFYLYHIHIWHSLCSKNINVVKMLWWLLSSNTLLPFFLSNSLWLANGCSISILLILSLALKSPIIMIFSSVYVLYVTEVSLKKKNSLQSEKKKFFKLDLNQGFLHENNLSYFWFVLFCHIWLILEITGGSTNLCHRLNYAICFGIAISFSYEFTKPMMMIFSHDLHHEI